MRLLTKSVLCAVLLVVGFSAYAEIKGNTGLIPTWCYTFVYGDNSAVPYPIDVELDKSPLGVIEIPGCTEADEHDLDWVLVPGDEDTDGDGVPNWEDYCPTLGDLLPASMAYGCPGVMIERGWVDPEIFRNDRDGDDIADIFDVCDGAVSEDYTTQAGRMGCPTNIFCAEHPDLTRSQVCDVFAEGFLGWVLKPREGVHYWLYADRREPTQTAIHIRLLLGLGGDTQTNVTNQCSICRIMDPQF